jgi:hypothetical protein
MVSPLLINELESRMEYPICEKGEKFKAIEYFRNLDFLKIGKPMLK